jgi:putative endonuclease
MKYFVYILQSLSDSSFYTGMTMDLQRRLQENNSGHTITTAKHLPWKLVYSEEFDSLEVAKQRERYFKTAAGRRFRTKILNSVPARPFRRVGGTRQAEGSNFRPQRFLTIAYETLGIAGFIPLCLHKRICGAE